VHLGCHANLRNWLMGTACGGCLLQAMATAFAKRKVFLKQRQAELNAQARFLAGE
jgi:hypothetical protein